MQNITPRVRTEEVDLPTERYPFDNILGDIQNCSHRRTDWFSWFAAAVLVLAVVSAVLEAW